MNTISLTITLNQDTGSLSVSSSADQLLYGDAIIMLELAKQQILLQMQEAMAVNEELEPTPEDEQEE